MTESNITHSQPPHRHLQKPGSCGMVLGDIMAKVFEIYYTYNLYTLNPLSAKIQ